MIYYCITIIYSDNQGCIENSSDPSIISLSEQLYGTLMIFPMITDHVHAVDPADIGPYDIGPYEWSNPSDISGFLCNGMCTLCILNLFLLCLFTVIYTAPHSIYGYSVIECEGRLNCWMQLPLNASWDQYWGEDYIDYQLLW